MKFLKTIYDFYLNTSIHVAFAVVSLVQITKLSLNISANFNFNYFVFFATILGYNFLKYLQVFWNRVFTVRKNFGIVFVSSIAIFEMIFYFFRLEFNFQLEFLKIGLLVLIYPLIRKYGLIKMLFVSFCLTFITVYIPTVNNNLHFTYCIQRFIIILCLLIPLEICNFEIDSRTLTTLPKIIGIINLKILGYFLLVLFCFLQFDFYNLFFAFLVAIAIYFSNQSRTKYYASFWVESLPIVYLVLVIIL